MVVGIHEIYGKMFDEPGFDRVVGDPARRVQATKTIKHLVMARIANPTSKRKSVIDLERDFRVKLDLNAVASPSIALLCNTPVPCSSDHRINIEQLLYYYTSRSLRAS